MGGGGLQYCVCVLFCSCCDGLSRLSPFWPEKRLGLLPVEKMDLTTASNHDVCELGTSAGLGVMPPLPRKFFPQIVLAKSSGQSTHDLLLKTEPYAAPSPSAHSNLLRSILPKKNEETKIPWKTHAPPFPSPPETSPSYKVRLLNRMAYSVKVALWLDFFEVNGKEKKKGGRATRPSFVAWRKRWKGGGFPPPRRNGSCVIY